MPTGRTPLALYGDLVRLTRRRRVDWSGVRTFNLDEFVGLGGGDAGSYRSFMESGCSITSTCAPATSGFSTARAATSTQECERYERAIAAAGGIDVMILGIGANGHIGFNEPAEALVARTHRVDARRADPRGQRAVVRRRHRTRAARGADDGDGDDPRARAIVLMATGEAKAEAVDAMLDGWRHDAGAGVVSAAAPAGDGDARRTVGRRDGYSPISCRRRGSMSSPMASRT